MPRNPDRLPLSLRAYRLATAAAQPLVPALLAARRKHGKEDPRRIGERRGVAGMARPDGPLVWLHGASVGEVLSIVPLIEQIAARGIHVLLTSHTMTSAALIGQRLGASVIHQFVPVDAPAFVGKFLDHWRPQMAVFAESDLWPNLLMAASARNIPLVLVNGRMSDRSFARWQKAPKTIGALLQRFDLCLAQSTADAERFVALGCPRVLSVGNLKLDVPAPPAHDDDLAELAGMFGTRPLMAAASTHAGEEAMVIDAHRMLLGVYPDLLTVIAPRHPQRGEGVAAIAEAAGFPVALRSRGEQPDAATGLYVFDTMGELGLLYRLTPFVFVGGSLIPHGGQNPIEPAKLGAAILHGPHVFNFAEIYHEIGRAGGAHQVTDAVSLATQADHWLRHEEVRAHAARSAQARVAELGGALERTLGALEPYLMQLQLARS